MKTKEQILKEVKEFYDHMTDEDLKQRLIEAGFEIIENGNGQIVFEEN